MMRTAAARRSGGHTMLSSCCALRAQIDPDDPAPAARANFEGGPVHEKWGKQGGTMSRVLREAF
jgi:hypothetical protein